MRTSITLPDDLTEQIDHHAAQDEITRAEWIRIACTAALASDHRTNTEELQQQHQRITEMEKILEAHREDGYKKAEQIEGLKRELQQKMEVITLHQDEIRWLRGEISKLTDTIPRLPEPGNNPWWMFWKR